MPQSQVRSPGKGREALRQKSQKFFALNMVRLNRRLSQKFFALNMVRLNRRLIRI